MSEKDYIGGQIIVVFKDGIVRKNAEKIAKDFGLALIIYFDFAHSAIFGCTVGDETRVIAELEKNESVECAAPNSYVKLINPVKG